MIRLSKKNPDQTGTDLLVYFAGESTNKIPSLQSREARRVLKQPWKEGDFSGKTDELFLYYPRQISGSRAHTIEARRVLIVGMGELKKGKTELCEQVRSAAGTATGQARKLKVKNVSVVLPDFTGLSISEVAECAAEGLILGNYLFVKYKKNVPEDEQSKHVEKFTLHDGGMNSGQVRKGMKRGTVAAVAATAARDMANEPGNGWTPAEFADFGCKLAKETALKCRVIAKSHLKKLGMGGILGVNQGSASPPKLIILEYRVDEKKPTLLLVGKGLTFDSGGISLKPAAGMQDMKYDMCGGAAVLAAMQGVAEEKPDNVNVVALIPATDNMAGAAALKPGDIITHYNGKTSEVVNTDAEGRLILADALSYGVKKYSPDAVVDIATLTGAVIIGLGHHRTGLLSNNDDLAQKIIDAGEKCGEPLWRLPLGLEYTKQLKSEVADLKNVGGKGAGTITAACYLQEFVDDTPWAHLDIAGTAWGFTEKTYIPGRGPSGTGVRTLLALVRDWKVSAA